MSAHQSAAALNDSLAGDLSRTTSQIGLNDKAIAALKAIAPLANKAVPEGIDYGHKVSMDVPELAGLMRNEQVREAIRAQHIKRWALVLNADFGQELTNMTLAASNSKASTGIDPRFHIAGYAHVLASIVKTVVTESFGRKGLFGKQGGDAELVGEGLAALMRAAFVDIDMVLNLYRKRSDDAQKEALASAAREQEEIGAAFAKSLSALANRDLTYRIAEELPGLFGKMRDDLNDAADQLGTTIADIDRGAANIRAGSGEISNATQDLARRTEQQAASIEETAAALEEITTTVNESAMRAEEAGKLVTTTRENAMRSGQIVEKAIGAMGEIEKSSGEISNIIGVIDNIAFQTNLLALNAGVEAARAGDAGKGFAVVAQEVRELAQRSAAAAKEIKALITKSSEQVKSGVDLVGETGKALETIMSQVNDINTNVTAIVDAAKEQATGLKEINHAVNTMDQGTQQNAAMVEQTSAASRALEDEVNRIASMLDAFRTGKRDGAHAAVSARSSAPVRAPSPVRSAARPVVSHSAPASMPARQQAAIAKAFGSSAQAAAVQSDWEEF